MTVNKERNGSELVLTLEGRLDTTTAPMLEKELKQEIGGVNLLIMNLRALNIYLRRACACCLPRKRL